MAFGFGHGFGFVRTGGGGAAFDPASLFAGGQAGAFFDSLPTQSFTDTGGTTPATVGDAQARINDLSGNGHNVIQASASARPILRQTAGGRYYSEIDAVDDILPFATNISYDDDVGFEIWAAVDTTSLADGFAIFLTRNGAQPSPYLSWSGGNRPSWYWSAATSNPVVAGDAAYSKGLNVIGWTAETVSGTTRRASIDINGAVTSADFTAASLTGEFFSRISDATQKPRVNLYSLLIYTEGNLTPAQRAQVKTWMQARIGL